MNTRHKRHSQQRCRSTNQSLFQSFGLIFGISLFLVFYQSLTINDFSTNNEVVLRNPSVGSPSKIKSPLRFVLFLGLEGTGHHFWLQLIKESPVYPRLVDLQLHPHYTKKLTMSLFRHKKSRWKGLWSSTCKWNDEDPSPNVTSIHENVVTVLRNMTTLVANAQNHDTISPIVIPFNLMGVGGNEFGVMSYPGFLKPCRPLIYPNLDVWYHACETAGVICQHVYIYREPYNVIKSTTSNRRFNSEALEAIHLYTTQLHILHTQLVSFPDRLVGCWNYDTTRSPKHFKEQIEPLLGFQNEKSFADVLQRIFRPKAPLTAEDKRNIVPKEYDLYMQSMVRLHDLVVKTCNDNQKVMY
jgi:hypothetical protein